MLVYVKDIKVKKSGCAFVDHYYGLSTADFFSDSELKQLQVDRIRFAILRGRELRKC